MRVLSLECEGERTLADFRCNLLDKSGDILVPTNMGSPHDLFKTAR